MIAYIDGTVAYAAHDQIILEVGGIGYRIFVTGSTGYRAQVGSKQKLFTYQHVREDAIILFGFQIPEERELFVRLQQVSGIGPKAALAILGAAAFQEIVQAIRTEQADFLTKVPGVGKKTAQRVIIDLKDKLEDLGAPVPISDVKTEHGDLRGLEVIEALMALGYNEKESKGAVRAIAKEIEEGSSIESQIKAALRLITRV